MPDPSIATVPPIRLTDLPDWRLDGAARVATDAVLPGGTPVAAGTLVMRETVTASSREGVACFPTPSAAALAINVSIRAARSAAALRATVQWDRPRVAPGMRVIGAHVGVLYSYFEEAMVAATFAMQAIEAFANRVIVLSGEESFSRKRGKEVVTLTPVQLERAASIEEKLNKYLPAITKRPAVGGSRLKAGFARLKAIRDASVHVKSTDHYSRTGDIDRESLYHRLLNLDARELPRAALSVMHHFSHPDHREWLDYATACLDTPLPEG